MNRKKIRPTIKDVAAHCGVSIATVSAVINRAGWVQDATRARVQKAIKDLGYRPNRLAQGLKTSQSYTVGVIVSDITNPFFTEIVRSLSHALREHERNMVLCDSDHRFDLGEKNFWMLLEKQVDAMVLIGDSVREAILRRYVDEGHAVPIVAIERDYPIDGVSKLLVDAEQGAFEATTHLIKQGYRNVGMISGPLTGPGSTTYGRLQGYHGYRKALAASGLAFEPAFVGVGNFRYEGGRQATAHLLALPDPPEAVFAANDLMALGALQAAREHGLHVPAGFAVVGYDDIPMAALAAVPLTTLAMPREDLGRVAAGLLMDELNHAEPYRPVRRLFSAQLIVRESSVRNPTPGDPGRTP